MFHRLGTFVARPHLLAVLRRYERESRIGQITAALDRTWDLFPHRFRLLPRPREFEGI